MSETYTEKGAEFHDPEKIAYDIAMLYARERAQLGENESRNVEELRDRFLFAYGKLQFFTPEELKTCYDRAVKRFTRSGFHRET